MTNHTPSEATSTDLAHSPAASDAPAPTLVIERSIKATAERLFDAWTQVEQFQQWWGPRGVKCHGAEIDLRVGGQYRIGNQFADGSVVWISGLFERIERPTVLVYSWSVEPVTRPPERVTVCFDETKGLTLVTVTHERITDQATSASHERGWIGCLDGLQAWLATAGG